MNRQTDKPSDLDLRLEALRSFFKEEATGPGPKRAQLNRACLKMIEQGFWNAGDRLPTDAEFTKILPLSIATVQASLKTLADQGVVIRRQRSGTTVASEEHLTRDLIFFRFTRPGHSGLSAPRNLEISIDQTSETGPWSDFLGPRPQYLQITRTFEVDGAFRLLSKLYLADPRLRILLDLPADSLRDVALRPLLQLRFGLPTVDLDWRSAFESFDAETASILQVAEGTTGQLFNVGMWTFDKTPLGFHRIWLPPNDHTMIISGDE